MKAFLQKHYPLIVLSLSALVLLIRAFYGFCWSDETFYYSIAYRFLQGDAPFVEEWYPTQLNSIFLMPFVGLYRLIAGGNDGLILTFRLLYVLACFGIAWLLFRVLCEETAKTCALISAMLFLFYTHLNILTFSYYAVSVLSATLSMLLIIRYLQRKEKGRADRYLFFSGIAFSVFVLSMPSMVLYYALAVVVLLILALIARLGTRSSAAIGKIRQLRPVHMLLWHFYGICTVAVPFLIYFVARVDLQGFLNALPYVLSDEEHAAQKTLYVILRKCFLNLSEAYGIFMDLCYVLIILALLWRILSAVKTLQKTCERFRTVAGSLLFAVDLVVFAGMFVKGAGHTGYVQVALFLFAFPLFLFLKKPPLHLFFTFVVLGGCMAFSYTYTSSGSPLYTESIGFAVASAVAPAVILCYVKELFEGISADRFRPIKAVLLSAGYAVLLCALLMTMVLRMVNIYRDDALSNLTARIPDGPAAGLLTSPEHLASYETVHATILEYCTKEAYPDGDHELLLLTKLLPWGYLCTDFRCASAYSWRSPLSSEHLQSYFRVHPEKYPDVVLILNEDIGSYETCGDVVADPIPNRNELSGSLYQYILDNHYIKKSVPCGTLFVRP